MWEWAVVRRGKTLLITAALLLSGAPSVRADVFYYRDADGVFHFTNVPTASTQPFIVDQPLGEIPKASAPTYRQPGFRGSEGYDEIIGEYAKRYAVEPALVKAVIRAESSFNRHAVSPKGACGLMQLMPRTARMYGVRNIHDPRENIHGGVRHLRMLLDKYRDNVPFVLAAYNAGTAPVERYRGIPPYPETRTYVSRVLQFRQQYLREQRLGRTVASRS